MAEVGIDSALYQELVDLVEGEGLNDWQAAVVYLLDELEVMRAGLSRSDCEGLVLNAARQSPWDQARFFIVLRDGPSYELRELDRGRWHFPLCRPGHGRPRRSRPSALADL